MTTFSHRLKQIRWYQWLLAALVLIYLVYIALSYLYLPGKLKQVLETDVSKIIGRNISVERFAFNPFVLSLAADRLSVADQPDRPIVGWQRFYVNFNLVKSVFKWEIALDELVVDQPEINLEKHGDRFNFSDIVERLGSGEEKGETAEEPPTEKSRMALEIFYTAVNRGTFRFADTGGKTPAHSDLDDITVEIEDLYLATGDERLSPFNLTARVPGGGNLTLAGQYRIDPLHVDADISADGIRLSTFSPFLENAVPLKVGNGILGFGANILATRDADLVLQVEKGRISVVGLAIDDDIPEPSLLRCKSITVDAAALDLAKQGLMVDQVMIEGLDVSQSRDKNGRLRYERLIPEDASTETPREGETASPWNILVKEIGIKESSVVFSDQGNEIPVDHVLSGVALDMKNLSFAPDAQATLSLGATINDAGNINMDGTMVMNPFSMDLNCKLDKIPLPPLSGYVEAASYVKIEGGSLSVEGDMSLGQKGNPSFRTTFDLTVADFNAGDTQTGAPLIRFAEFRMNDVDVDAGKEHIDIAAVSLAKPELFVEMSADGGLNLAGLAKPAVETSPVETPDEGESTPGETPAAKVPDEAEDGGGWTYTIGKIELTNGTAKYTDGNVTPEFQTGLYDLAVSTDRVASPNGKSTPFSVSGKIDQYAPVNISGTLAPLDKQPGFAFTCDLKGLEMPGLSPYAAKFIGNNLKSGKLSLALDYSLAERRLKGKNNIVAENLRLGDPVPGDPVIKAPVGLGLALLRDVSGVIDLNVGVAGDLDDPGFSVSGIVIKALANVFIKAAASPFKLLGALVGGREDIGEIEFDGGIASLNDENRERLKLLAAALTQKPHLAVQLRGNAGDKEDVSALQAIRVKEMAAASRKIQPAELAGKSGQAAWWTLPENRDAIVQLNDGLELPTLAERTAALKKETPETTDAALATEIYRRMVADITAAQEIGTDELIQLADQRALSIKQHLVDGLKLDHTRVSVTKTEKGDLTGRVIKLEIKTI